MTETEHAAPAPASVEEMQHGWHELTLRVEQLEGERAVLEQDNKTIRFLLEQVIDHRQKSHNELVLIITTLVSKLPINDVGAIVARLVEHNTNCSQHLAALVKGTAEAAIPQPEILKTLDQTKRDLLGALKPIIEQFIKAETPLETDLLQSLLEHPELFFSPRVVRANRCFAKGYVPRERVLKEFGESGLAFFNDVTTDAKLNPNPKPEEIALAFKNDFEALFQLNPGILPEKRQELLGLYQRIQRSKAATEEARLQKNLFLRMSFILDLLHFYDNQGTEAPDAIFAQRLPSLIEQLVLVGPQEQLDEKLIIQAEALLAFVISPDYRQMILN